jgi:hypothetical protein
MISSSPRDRSSALKRGAINSVVRLLRGCHMPCRAPAVLNGPFLLGIRWLLEVGVAISPCSLPKNSHVALKIRPKRDESLGYSTVQADAMRGIPHCADLFRTAGRAPHPFAAFVTAKLEYSRREWTIVAQGGAQRNPGESQPKMRCAPEGRREISPKMICKEPLKPPRQSRGHSYLK